MVMVPHSSYNDGTVQTGNLKWTLKRTLATIQASRYVVGLWILGFGCRYRCFHRTYHVP